MTIDISRVCVHTERGLCTHSTNDSFECVPFSFFAAKQPKRFIHIRLGLTSEHKQVNECVFVRVRVQKALRRIIWVILCIVWSVMIDCT